MMAPIGYWAAREQYSMHELLKFVIEAEKGGFTTTMTSRTRYQRLHRMRLDRVIEWKQKEVKGCVDAHESERLFTELEALEWLQRQVRRRE